MAGRGSTLTLAGLVVLCATQSGACMTDPVEKAAESNLTNALLNSFGPEVILPAIARFEEAIANLESSNASCHFQPGRLHEGPQGKQQAL